MGRFENLVAKFNNIQSELRSLGQQLPEAYPDMPKINDLAEEIGVAIDAMGTLAQTFESILQEVESDQSLYNEFVSKIESSDPYSKWKPDEQKKLAEWLVNKKQDLADRDTLIEETEENLKQKDIADLVNMYPKALILQRGQEMGGQGGDDFDAYQMGVEALRRDFEMDKDQAVEKLAGLQLERGLDAVAREFYQEALSPEQPEGEASDVDSEENPSV